MSLSALTKPVDKGTGMGLSVVQGIVRGHNGAITVFSEPGKGSTFHVHLPILKEDVTPLEKRMTAIQTEKGTVLSSCYQDSLSNKSLNWK